MTLFRLIQKIKNTLFPQVPSRLRDEYFREKFNQNLYRIFFVALFLFFEQGIYALFVSEDGSLLQRIYFLTSSTMVLVLGGSLYFYRTKKRRIRITIFHKLFELAPALLGIGIILLRIFLVNFDCLRLPTIYLAVIYVIAVIFLFSYLQSLFLYLLLSTLVILLLPVFYPGAETHILHADIISNGLLAWLIAVVHYSNFSKIYLNQKTIEETNKRLEQKNSEIVKMNKVLERISTYDALTGIYNRRKIEELIATEIAFCERYDHDFSVLLLDVDHFKKVNDNFGHDIGDEVLNTISNRIKKDIRETDSCGRWGGEEFLIIARRSNAGKASILAERIRTSIDTLVFKDVSHVTVSIGIASFKETGNKDDLFKTADTRLYKAKNNGRNRVEKD